MEEMIWNNSENIFKWHDHLRKHLENLSGLLPTMVNVKHDENLPVILGISHQDQDFPNMETLYYYNENTLHFDKFVEPQF